MKHRLLILLLGFGLTSFGQDYGLKDDAYYKTLEPVYQRWLQKSGLAQFLKVAGSDTEDGLFSLYLGFTCLGNDSAVVAWNTMKAEFDAAHEFTIETQLYRSMVSIMRINPALANLQIYSTDLNGQEGCFYRGLYYDETTKAVGIDEQNCMSAVPHELQFTHEELKSSQLVKFNTAAEIDHEKNKQLVFAKILQMAQNEYKAKVQKGDFFHDKTKKSVLYFEVKNLRAEVFAEEENSFVAETMNWFGSITGFGETKNDWRTIEELHFYIQYVPSADKRSFDLEVDIKGKYGSGYHQINQWNRMIDMQRDFDPLLEDYQTKFANKIYELIIP